MRYFFLLVILIFSLSSYSQQSKEKTSFTYQCFQNADSTWGYNLLKAGKVFIHQPTIPAIPGNKGFATKANAASIAKLAVKKLKSNPGSFPTISTKELQTLKIIY
jgi:hypothetical protein